MLEVEGEEEVAAALQYFLLLSTLLFVEAVEVVEIFEVEGVGEEEEEEVSALPYFLLLSSVLFVVPSDPILSLFPKSTVLGRTGGSGSRSD